MYSISSMHTQPGTFQVVYELAVLVHAIREGGQAY